MRRTLCVWLPNWPIQRLTLAQPELKGRAIALCGTRRNVRRVAACSAEAAALGVRTGMPAAEAAALAGQGKGWSVVSGQWSVAERDATSTAHCPLPTAHFLPHDPAADRAALEELAVWCSRFSPAVGVEEAGDPDSLLLDITGLEHLLGDEPAQAARILAALAGRGLSARIGVADAPGAAWAAARFGGSCKLKIDDCKLQIKDGGSALPSICNLQSAICNHQSSISIFPPGQSPAALAPLPVEALRLPEETVGLLHSLGVYQAGQLARLPREDLAARFGPGPARRLDQALGLLPEPIRACGAPPELRAEWPLEFPAARREAVEAVVEQLVGQVAARLVGHGRGALRLECRLDCQAAPAVNLCVGLYQATASAAHLAGLVRLQLERVRLPAPVTAVRVEAALTAPLEHRQQSLLDEELARRRQDLAALIDRLASRLGPRSVLRARLLADAQPELAVCYDPVVGERERRRRQRDCKLKIDDCKLKIAEQARGARSICNLQSSISNLQFPSTAHCPLPTAHFLPPPRPLRLLARPAALAASSVLPEGPPVQFEFQGSWHRVARTWGPERIETGWWRGRAVGRDYYRVETAAGRRFWLFRRLRDGKWFLHGAFG